MLIHELAHGITAIIFGGEFKGLWITTYFGFGEKSEEVSNFAFYTYTSYNNNLLCYICVKIAGSLTAILSALVINFISKRKKSFIVSLTSYVIIFYELIYWTLSPLIKFGDAYQLLQSLGIKDLFEILLFSLICFLLSIYTLLSLIKTYKKLFFIIN
ncbi:MAG: hypothetical protein ACFFAH_08600 [Promethearchaeota archaeon]